jgi:hypothetical protein
VKDSDESDCDEDLAAAVADTKAAMIADAAAAVAGGKNPSKKDLHDLLVRQLKTVIKAQHSKIEELRAASAAVKSKVVTELPHEAELGPSAIFASTKIQAQIIEDLRRNASKDREERSKLVSQVRRLQNLVTELRADNQELKHTNKRYQGLLSEVGHSPSVDSVTAPTEKILSAAVPMSSSPSSAVPDEHGDSSPKSRSRRVDVHQVALFSHSSDVLRKIPSPSRVSHGHCWRRSDRLWEKMNPCAVSKFR